MSYFPTLPKVAFINLTKYWLEEIIIGLDLCPFASIPYKNGLIRITECEAATQVEMVNAFLDELDHIQQSTPTIVSTTLLVFNQNKEDFLDFSDFVGLCEELLEEAGLLEHFQLVIFHPGFYFENTNEEDVENFVNRSPYPIIHILRNAEIEMAMAKATSGGMDVSLKNKEKLKALSPAELRKLYFYLQ